MQHDGKTADKNPLLDLLEPKAQKIVSSLTKKIIQQEQQLAEAEASLREEKKKSELFRQLQFHSLDVMETLEKEVKERQRLEKVKDDFLTTVSHELRTPLAIIIGYISNLSDGILGDLQPAQKKAMDILKKNGDRLARLINDLLDFSRLESGVQKVRKSKFHLGSMLNGNSASLLKVAEEHHVELTTDIPDLLPAVCADMGMIEQAFTNLVSNAVRFAESKVHVEVNLWETSSEDVSEKNEYLYVCVSDDGPGIALKEQKNIFDKFVQVNRPSGGAGYKGTGLGLPICREIVNLNNGKLWLESTPGKGCRFFFTIPLYQYDIHFDEMIEHYFGSIKRSGEEVVLLTTTLQSDQEEEEHETHLKSSQLNTLSKNVQKSVLRHSDVCLVDDESYSLVVIASLPTDKIDIWKNRIEEFIAEEIKKLLPDNSFSLGMSHIIKSDQHQGIARETYQKTLKKAEQELKKVV